MANLLQYGGPVDSAWKVLPAKNSMRIVASSATRDAYRCDTGRGEVDRCVVRSSAVDRYDAQRCEVGHHIMIHE